jgi:sugar lactone lactonase YvrE
MKTLFNMLAALIMVAIPRLEAQPVITQQPTNQTVIAGGNAGFGVSVSGTGPFTYQWQLNGTNLPYGIITTIAGNGIAGYFGDGGPATSAAMYYPNGLVVDAQGNLLFADFQNCRIRKIDTNGIITTVAGNGTAGFSGDGGPATNAVLNYPNRLALDTQGNLFFADEYNFCIRKIDTNGIITTVGGTGGVSGFYGDGGPAINARLNLPLGVVLDRVGNLYLSDNYSDRIRKIDTNGIITTIAGNGIASSSGDGGPATNATLNSPFGLARDEMGNLFIADYYSGRVRKIDLNGIISTVAGNGTNGYSGDGGPASMAQLNYPNDVAVDAFGNLLITDASNNRIRKVATNGIITTVAGNGTAGFSGDGGPATNADLNGPWGTTLDGSGNLFISDNNNQRIRMVDYSAGQPTLKLNPVSTNNAGNYSVIVTGAGGSVTSSVASLTITGYNQVAGQYLGGGKMQLSFVGNGSGNYALDRSFSLAPPNWVPQVTNLAGARGALVFTNTPDPSTNNFWRIRSVSSSAINIGSLGTVANGTYSIIADRGVPGAIQGDNANSAVRFPAYAPLNRVAIPFLSALNPNGPFSAEFWAKPSGTNSAPCPLSSVDFGTYIRSGWLFYQGGPALTDGNGFFFGIYNTSSGTSRTQATTSIPVNTNAWYHVVGVFDGANAILYVNGVNAASAALPNGQSFRPCTASAMTFGQRSDGNFPFAGDLDEGAFYTNALTAAQVAAHYQAGTNAAPAIPYQQVILNDHPAGYGRFNEQ